MSILSHTRKTPPLGSSDKIQDVSADIAEEFKNFVNDVELLVKESAYLSGDDLARAKIKLNQRINAAKHYLNNARNKLVDQTQKAATATNTYVHEKPWTAIGTGAVVSFVLGLLLGQRNDDLFGKPNDQSHKPNDRLNK